jgi:diaminopimelate epimerase
MKPKFIKMEGLGNSFLICEGPLLLTGEEIADCCTNSNVDGILAVVPISSDCIEMKYWNADGTVAEMCGNGLRCVTRYAVDNKLVSPGKFMVKTDAGVLKVVWDGKDANSIETQLGKVKLDPKPVQLQGLDFYMANIGNPHAITFVNNTDKAEVKIVGPVVENDKYFPNKTNVEFVQILGKDRIRVRTWERGAGETKACGTGMAVAAATSKELKNTQFPLTVEVLGGSAKVWADEESYLRMIGPANIVSDDNYVPK